MPLLLGEKAESCVVRDLWRIQNQNIWDRFSLGVVEVSGALGLNMRHI